VVGVGLELARAIGARGLGLCIPLVRDWKVLLRRRDCLRKAQTLRQFDEQASDHPSHLAEPVSGISHTESIPVQRPKPHLVGLDPLTSQPQSYRNSSSTHFPPFFKRRFTETLCGQLS
jgi:hypothetical protein